MPREDGLALCRELRAKPNSPPIIMLTNRAEKDDIAAGLNAGADDYIVKPEAGNVVLARIEAGE